MFIWSVVIVTACSLGLLIVGFTLQAGAMVARWSVMKAAMIIALWMVILSVLADAGAPVQLTVGGLMAVMVLTPLAFALGRVTDRATLARKGSRRELCDAEFRQLDGQAQAKYLERLLSPQ